MKSCDDRRAEIRELHFQAIMSEINDLQLTTASRERVILQGKQLEPSIGRDFDLCFHHFISGRCSPNIAGVLERPDVLFQQRMAVREAIKRAANGAEPSQIKELSEMLGLYSTERKPI